MSETKSLSRRGVIAGGAGLLSGSLIAATVTRSEAATLVGGHKANPELVRLNRLRLAAKTEVEHDRHLHDMLAIPARNPADLALKLSWLISDAPWDENEERCPFVATYASVSRDLGLPMQRIVTVEEQRIGLLTAGEG